MKELSRQRRGELTPRVKQKSKQLFGYEIGITELRLMPYLHYQLVNEKRLTNVSEEERKILAKWVKEGYILNGISANLGRPMMSADNQIEVTKGFWNIISEIMFLAYVDTV